jgi:hypothetical protein
MWGSGGDVCRIVEFAAHDAISLAGAGRPDETLHFINADRAYPGQLIGGLDSSAVVVIPKP